MSEEKKEIKATPKEDTMVKVRLLDRQGWGIDGIQYKCNDVIDMTYGMYEHGKKYVELELIK